jgi:hypothetical protein
MGRAEHANQKASQITIHAHGDGTYHSESGYDSKRVEHPSAAHAAAHFLKQHATGDHMVIEGHEDGYTSHGIHDGKMHGPEEHSTMRGLKSQVTDCMDGDCNG